MNELFNRIIAWHEKNLPAGLPYEPLPQIGFLNKELNEVIDEFIAGNIDKAVGEICDIIVFSVNALVLLDWHNELLEADFDKSVIESFNNKECVRLLMQCVFNVTYTATAKKTNTEILCDKYTILICVCFNCIESLGYSPKLALLETVKKIESRRGAWNPETGKWEKEKNQADVYVPDYCKAKIKKEGE